MKKLRVLLVSDYAPNIINAGSERLIFGIAQGLVKNYGITVDLLAPNWNNLAEKEVVDGVTIHRFKTHSIFNLNKFNAVRRILDFIRVGLTLPKYDLYHGFYTTPPLLAAAALAKMRRASYIAGIFTRKQIEENFKNIILKQILMACMRQAKFITTTAWSVEKYFKENYFKNSNFRVIPCWVEDYFRPKSVSRADKKIILYVGRMIAEKGIFVLLDAFVKVMGKIKAKLVLVGPTYEILAVKKKISELNLENSVEIVGFVSEEELSDWYNRADVIVSPAIGKDAFTWTAMEAMACGKPVIVTETLGSTDNFGDFGIVVPQKDASAISTALIKFFSDDEFRLKCGEGALKTAQALFSKPKVMEKYFKLYLAAAKS